MTLLNSTPFFLLPRSLAGWGWFAILSLGLIYLLLRWRRYNAPMGGRQWGIALILTLLLPALFFGGFQVSVGRELPPPDLPMEPILPVMMVFSALSWFFAARLLGTRWAVFFAALSGLALGLWNTHSIFTPLEMAILAALLSAALRQPYRTWQYSVLRHPLGGAAFVALFFPALFFTNQAIENCISLSYDVIVSSVDYALTLILPYSVAFWGPIFLAGFLALILRRFKPALWGDDVPSQPSPAESSLEVRFFYTLGPMFILLILVLIVGVGIIVGRVSDQVLMGRLQSTARVSADSVPFYLQTGQNMIHQLAGDGRLYAPGMPGTDDKGADASQGLLKAILEEKMNLLPFFDNLTFLDKDGTILASTVAANENVNLYPEEISGARLAIHGIPVQSYAIPAESDGQSARISFLAAVQDDQNRVQGVLIGRSEVATNPLMEPVITSLKALGEINGIGYLLDEDDRILYQSGGERTNLRFPDYGPHAYGELIEKSGDDGTRKLLYFTPVTGRDWTIVLSVPAVYPHWITLWLVIPFIGLLVLTVLLVWRMMQYSLKKITRSLNLFVCQADRIADGELDYNGMSSALADDEANEIGDLRYSFEKMRLGLKSRLEELNQLLIVSQQVASTLEIDQVVYPILESALRNGASSARVVLNRISPYGSDGDDEENLSYYGVGGKADQYRYLDDQIFDLARMQDLILLTNVPRASLLHFVTSPAGTIISPQALLAVALRRENTYLGTFWVAFDQPRLLDAEHEDVRFLITLASQMGVAAANSRLYLTSELGRQRLEAILEATPDPVLVTDEQGRLLLANPAACEILGENNNPPSGEPTGLQAVSGVGRMIQNPDLVRLMLRADEEVISTEISLPQDRHYLATVSPVLVAGKKNGRVCVMQDVTRFKELDAMKSDFVSTVSHDLRAPITLIQGYVTMVEMVGDLSDKQMAYVHRISEGLKKMNHLVDNLLDLGWIESGIALQLETVSVGDLVDQVASAYQLPAQQKHLEFTTLLEKQPAQAEIEVDVYLIQEALQNLLENAIKFTEPFGTVKLEADVRDGEAVFTVSDNGMGIAPIDQARLYEKFYRVGGKSSLSRDYGAEGGAHKQGTGLGLAIVKSIAERHHGRVWVDSQLGKGSSFFLAVPVRQTEK